jgi:hypothetical protein
MSAAMIRDITSVIYGDCSSGSHGEADKARSARLEQWLATDGDEADAVLVDMRRLNKSEEHYDVFWEVMAEFLDQHEMKVQARRHGTTCDTPIAWSISSLKKEIIEFASNPTEHNHSFSPLLPDQVPSDQWVRMSFSPSNPWVSAAKYYQCKFDIRFRLLSRNAHSEHQDGEYCARILKYLRHLAVELKHKLGVQHIIFMLGDDKSSFKIGDPNDALAVLERSKGCWQSQHAAQASMHDFASFKGNPSVWLMTHIPDCALESFYRGIVYVCIKDAVFQPSTPLRHATEVKGIIGDKMKDLRVLLMYTDGGPDHNVKYLTVWVSLIWLFLSGDLDLLVAARTCPTQSWKNVVERLMCILNLAMYGVTVVRKHMGDMEPLIKAASGSMSSIRAAAVPLDPEDDDNVEAARKFAAACSEAVQPVRELLHSRFANLNLKGEDFQIFNAATEDDLIEMFACFAIIDAEVPKKKEGMSLKTKQLRTYGGFKSYAESHMDTRDYFFVLGKYCQH